MRELKDLKDLSSILKLCNEVVFEDSIYSLVKY